MKQPSRKTLILIATVASLPSLLGTSVVASAWLRANDNQTELAVLAVLSAYVTFVHGYAVGRFMRLSRNGGR